MITCPSCGSEYSDETIFCTKCYKPITSGESGMVSEQSITDYASFLHRAGACVIDNVIVSVAIAILGALLGASVGETFLRLIFFAIAILYLSLMESSKYRATLGKIALKLIVTDLQGNRISFSRALGRRLAAILSGISIIGLLMVLFTKKKQALHDMIAGTLVLNKK
jgi:uncharacterized RDD family membrane protein YckC